MAKLNIRIHEGKEDLKAFNPRTVKIGDQTWMQENLAIDDGGDGIYYNEKNRQYYYTWDAAKRIAKSINGWHLPSAEEWNAAAEACGATVVDNKYKDNPYMRDYEGTDKLYDSLNVLPVGRYGGGSFLYVGSYAYFWSATKIDSYYAYSRGFGYAYSRGFGTSDTMLQDTNYEDNGFSVRLVKD